MAFDAFFLSAVLEEVRTKCVGARIDKIHQPSRDTLILHMHSREHRTKLLFAANPTAPRLHLTTASPENPAEPPMFCMLLRKHLMGAKLAEVSQPPMERAATMFPLPRHRDLPHTPWNPKFGRRTSSLRHM